MYVTKRIGIPKRNKVKIILKNSLNILSVVFVLRRDQRSNIHHQIQAFSRSIFKLFPAANTSGKSQIISIHTLKMIIISDHELLVIQLGWQNI